MSCLLYCRVVVLVIKGQDKKMSRLTAYTHLWTRYARGTIELNSQLKEFAESMNSLCDNLFPNYPLFPKYSIWRAVVKVWSREVLKPLRSELNNLFFKLLLNHRIASLLDLSQDSNIILDKMPMSFFQLSKLKSSHLLEDFKEFFDKLKVN